MPAVSIAPQTSSHGVSSERCRSSYGIPSEHRRSSHAVSNEHRQSSHVMSSGYRRSRGISFAGSSPMKSSSDNDVHHRSDILMQEQISYANNLQTMLEQSLSRLEKCHFEGHSEGSKVDSLRIQVFQLKQRSQEVIIMLHLVGKLHTELHYARQELQKSLKQGGDVNLLRKRVGWLEDRMESLLVKQRDDTPMMNASRSTLAPGGANALEDGYVSDRSSISAEEGQSILGSPIQHVLPKKQNRKDTSTDTASLSGDSDQQIRKKRTRKAKLEHGKRNASSKKRSNLKIPQPESSSTDDGAESDDERDFQDDGSTSVGFGISQTEEESHQTSHDLETRSEGQPEGQLEEASDGGHAEKAMVPRERSSVAPSRVTLRTPTELAELFGEIPESDDLDLGAAYWQQEHHRFEYSNHAQLMCDLNPLSFHQMGVAVPGTFVEPVDTSSKLPWRPVNATDMTDIHRVSLDKLLQRIHKFYDKISDGAYLSVNNGQDLKTHPGLVNVMNSFDFAFTPMSRGSSVPPALSKILSQSRPRTQDTTQFPDLNAKRIGTSVSGRLIYYPKPLPYPEKLPLCKTDRSQDYPKLPEIYSSSEPGLNHPAERIVNQRNLFNETKFTSSLFHSKHGRKKEPVAQPQIEQKTRGETPGSESISHPVKKVTLKSTMKMARAAVSFKEGAKKRWEEMKPHSGALDHSGLKWERVKGMVHDNLVSSHIEERVDAARNLGQLHCGDAMVLFALKERLEKDEELRVKYEAAKSLVLLGCWEENILCILVSLLQQGNDEIRADIMKTIINGKNVQYVNKHQKYFPMLTAILSELCSDDEISDSAAMDAALCLSRLCVSDDNARNKLRSILQSSSDTHVHIKVLDALIKQLNCTEWDVVHAVLKLLETSTVWKYRCQAAQLLIVLGKSNVCLDNQVETVYEILEKRLWDDPIKQVKLDVARALAALELFPRACERAEKRLSDPFENSRVQAVASLGTLGMKSDRIVRVLLEMLQLDSSEAVRVMVIKTFAILHTLDKRVIRALREKEKGDGIMAKEARKTIEALGLQVYKTEVKVKKNLNVLRASKLFGK